MRILLVTMGIMLATTAHGVTLLADNFDSQPDWQRGTDPGVLANCQAKSAPNCWDTASGIVEIAGGHGINGSKGKRYFVGQGGGTTMGCQMTQYNYDQVSSLFYGYWYRVENVDGGDVTDWGTNSAMLKWLRFYINNESVIPEIKHGEVIVFWAGANRATNLHRITDTNWHKYIWEFQAGTPGVIRLWVDDAMVYENTSVDWHVPNPTFFRFNDGGGAPALTVQGNMSGDYNGPSKYLYWDEFIAATTMGEVTDFLGGSPGTEPPPEPDLPPGGLQPLTAPTSTDVQAGQ